MSRLINLVLAFLVLMGAFWLYQVKHQAKETEETIARLEKEIKDEKEALSLLRAEWSYLNRPERVQSLSEKFAGQLGLKEVEPYQIGEAEDLPDRKAGALPDAQSQQSIRDLLGKASAKTAPNVLQ